jgi:hypothetical protein
MAENQFSNVMDFVNELNKSHGVTQRGGKKYTKLCIEWKRSDVFLS